jgi:hypothetical protein
MRKGAPENSRVGLSCWDQCDSYGESGEQQYSLTVRGPESSVRTVRVSILRYRQRIRFLSIADSYNIPFELEKMLSHMMQRLTGPLNGLRRRAGREIAAQPLHLLVTLDRGNKKHRGLIHFEHATGTPRNSEKRRIVPIQVHS